MVGEITMICMDNSKWMTEEITWFVNQIRAIELYCERKLKAHPDNLVGIFRMGELDLGFQLYPTKNFQLVKCVLKRFIPSSTRQNLDLLLSLELCTECWFDHKHLDKRIVVFAGGPCKFPSKQLKASVKVLKEGEDTSVVIDVVDFFPVLDDSKADSLKKLVKHMNEQNIFGVDWRKLDTQRGAVLATELKNNANKIAKWTAQAILASADMMKLGYVTRVHPRDHFNHVILAVVGYKAQGVCWPD
ncbi:eukaryotic translation initiation factor 3 subunit 7 (eIF-3) [Artemisia annua]|uniref:Eukaryotic translation initiation factor 3 subunit 7 (eIF-3) n=1 Tax=Artemisia annua TaxID=35608 RepID=A0A2U1QB28_ARTAN|nr:eukaryotic translation initiation factor 3 subunit 7 (eIF-3) [Artemisia annua]